MAIWRYGHAGRALSVFGGALTTSANELCDGRHQRETRSGEGKSTRAGARPYSNSEHVKCDPVDKLTGFLCAITDSPVIDMLQLKHHLQRMSLCAVSLGARQSGRLSLQLVAGGRGWVSRNFAPSVSLGGASFQAEHYLARFLKSNHLGYFVSTAVALVRSLVLSAVVRKDVHQ